MAGLNADAMAGIDRALAAPATAVARDALLALRGRISAAEGPMPVVALADVVYYEVHAAPAAPVAAATPSSVVAAYVAAEGELRRRREQERAAQADSVERRVAERRTRRRADRGAPAADDHDVVELTRRASQRGRPWGLVLDHSSLALNGWEEGSVAQENASDVFKSCVGLELHEVNGVEVRTLEGALAEMDDCE
eukprot:gene30207-21108_t